MKETISRRYEARLENEDGNEVIWLTVNMANVSREKANRVIREMELLKGKVEGIVAG